MALAWPRGRRPLPVLPGSDWSVVTTLASDWSPPALGSLHTGQPPVPPSVRPQLPRTPHTPSSPRAGPASIHELRRPRGNILYKNLSVPFQWKIVNKICKLFLAPNHFLVIKIKCCLLLMHPCEVRLAEAATATDSWGWRLCWHRPMRGEHWAVWTNQRPSSAHIAPGSAVSSPQQGSGPRGWTPPHYHHHCFI